MIWLILLGLAVVALIVLGVITNKPKPPEEPDDAFGTPFGEEFD